MLLNKLEVLLQKLHSNRVQVVSEVAQLLYHVALIHLELISFFDILTSLLGAQNRKLALLNDLRSLGCKYQQILSCIVHFNPECLLFVACQLESSLRLVKQLSILRSLLLIE